MIVKIVKESLKDVLQPKSPEAIYDDFDDDVRLYEGEEDQLLSRAAQQIVKAELFSMEQILKLQNYAARW